MTPALGNGQQQGCNHCQGCGCEAKAKAAAGQHHQFTRDALIELVKVAARPQQRCAKGQKGWHRPENLGDQGPASLKLPSRRFSACNPFCPAPATPSQPPFTHQQHHHHAEGDQGKPHGPSWVAFRLPGLKDASRQTGDSQQLHSTELVHHLHAHQGNACTDGGKRHR